MPLRINEIEITRLLDEQHDLITCSRCARRFTYSQFHGDLARGSLAHQTVCGRCMRAWWVAIDKCARRCLDVEILHCKPQCPRFSGCWFCTLQRRVDALLLYAEGLNSPIDAGH